MDNIDYDKYGLIPPVPQHCHIEFMLFDVTIIDEKDENFIQIECNSAELSTLLVCLCSKGCKISIKKKNNGNKDL